MKGKISWECDITWTLTIQFKQDFLSYLIVQKIITYIAKQCSHVEFPYFVIGSHLGRQHMTHYFWWSLMGGTKIIIRTIMWPTSFVQVWTLEFIDCENFILNFKLNCRWKLFKFHGFKITKSLPRNLTHRGLLKNIKSVPQFP